eukprot:Nitzschia sp. Nitz4//scaffold436_size7492//6531//7211//NITZ4_009157-RA/size7492-processed-gene-0.8-mRNA-1//1//CDS//3329551851//8704//frame0
MIPTAGAAATKAVSVKIVSDIACPFCYIGLRHLELASQASGVKVDLEWLPFLLNPTMREEGEDMSEYYTRKYGPNAKDSFLDPNSRLHIMGRKVGIEFSDKRRAVNTRRAHALVELVKTQEGREAANKLMIELYKSYFEDGADINDESLLIKMVQQFGVNESDAKSAMANDKLLDVVRQYRENQSAFAVSSVPFFIVQPNDDSRSITFSGAYPPEIIAEQLNEAAH